MLLTFEKKIIIAIVTLAMFIEFVDATALNTSLPQIAATFNLKSYDISLVITIYLFALSIGIPLSGYLVERFGNKNILMCAFIIFLFSSLACGMACSITQLIFFRLMQGISASFMLPVGRLLIAQLFGKDIIKAMTIVTTISLSGTILGPVLGGYLTTYLGWRWIFFINIPFLFVGLILSIKYLSANQAKRQLKFDFLGFFILLFGFSFLIFSSNWFKDNLVYGALIAFLGMFIILLYIPYAKVTNYALINIKIFNNESFKKITYANFIIRLTNGALIFFIPLFLFEKCRYTAFEISFLMLPLVFGSIIIKPFLAKILTKIHAGSLLIINTYALAAMQLLFIIFINNFYYVVFISYCIILGILNSIQVSLMNSSMFLSLSNNNKPQGNALYLSVSQLGSCIGITLTSLILILFNSSLGLGYYFLICSIAVVTIFANAFFISLQNATDNMVPSLE